MHNNTNENITNIDMMTDNITKLKGPKTCNYFKFTCPNGEEKY